MIELFSGEGVKILSLNKYLYVETHLRYSLLLNLASTSLVFKLTKGI